MAKSKNGMGSIRLRKDGRYEARYTGADGKQHSIFSRSSSDAARKLRAATAAVDSGTWLKPSRLTVAGWLEIWLRDYCGQIRESSRRRYETQAKRIAASIGTVQLSRLSSVHIRRVLTDAQREGLAPVTIDSLRTIMATAMNRAVEAHLLKENPVSQIHLPKAQAVRQMHIIDRPQLPAFFAAARETRHANELIFLLLTGLRIGEALGLTWDMVDLDKGQITVSRQLVRRASGEYVLADTKTGTTRQIRIVPEAVDILRAQRTEQARDRLRMGRYWITDEPCDNLVFRTPQGRHLLFTVIAQAVKAVGGKIGMPALHPHDLRHSYAVAALRSGMDVKTVQHNLGHTSAAMTLDVYARYSDDAAIISTGQFADYINSALQLGSN